MASGADAFKSEPEGEMITGINVTPLVDITLVLLIVFMVTTSYIVNPSIKVNLPKAASGSEQLKTQLALTLDTEGQLFLNGEPSTNQAVRAFIAETLPAEPDLQAVIAADSGVTHGLVVGLIDLVKTAGVKRFAINVDGAVDGAAGEAVSNSAGDPSTAADVAAPPSNPSAPSAESPRP